MMTQRIVGNVSFSAVSLLLVDECVPCDLLVLWPLAVNWGPRDDGSRLHIPRSRVASAEHAALDTGAAVALPDTRPFRRNFHLFIRRQMETISAARICKSMRHFFLRRSSPPHHPATGQTTILLSRFFSLQKQTDPFAGYVSHFHCNSTFVLFSGRKSLYCCLRYGASVTLRQDGAERNPHCVHLRSSVSGSGELQPLHRQQIPCTRHLYPPPIDQIIEYLLCIPPGPL